MKVGHSDNLSDFSPSGGPSQVPPESRTNEFSYIGVRCPTFPVYLTADQVGDLLQLSAKSVYRLAKDNPTMPVLKLGGTVRFHRERLERWLRDREQGSPRPRRSTIPPQPTGRVHTPAGADR
jgi:excisionase family DNA binding protein